MALRLPPIRTLIAIAVLIGGGGLCVALGRWQLARAEQSRAVAVQFAAGVAQRPLEQVPADRDAERLRFQRVALDGGYAAEQQFLLDNSVHDGVAGYDVLTPFRPTEGGPWVLVNRGFVAVGLDRRKLPEIAVDDAKRRVVGRIDRLPRPGLRLGNAAAPERSTEPVTVVSFPTAAEITARLGHPVHDYQLLLEPNAADGYVRDWRAPGLGPERHLAYAGQWFLFAVGGFAVAATLAFKALRSR